jgi:LPXTG-motif cell wall-anchored protein
MHFTRFSSPGYGLYGLTTTFNVTVVCCWDYPECECERPIPPPTPCTECNEHPCVCVETPITPQPPVRDTTTSENNVPTAPKTGDTNRVLPLVITFMFSSSALMALLTKRKEIL